MTDFFQICMVCFGAGINMFELLMGDSRFNPTSVVLLIMAVANWLLPMERFNKFIFRVKEEELDEEDWETAKFEFPSVIIFISTSKLLGLCS